MDRNWGEPVHNGLRQWRRFHTAPRHQVDSDSNRGAIVGEYHHCTDIDSDHYSQRRQRQPDTYWHSDPDQRKLHCPSRNFERRQCNHQCCRWFTGDGHRYTEFHLYARYGKLLYL
jgi:hypothetical protein